MARADYTTIAKDSNTQQPQQTGAGTHDKHLPSPTTKFPQNAPPAPHQKKRRAPETPKRRSNIDQGLERSLARANCAAIAKDRNINTQQPRQTGALEHTRQAPSISNDQIPPKRFKRKTDRKRRRRQRRRRALGRPACAPARAAAARAARARAAAAADDRADAREGRRERRVGDWHGARVAAAAPPTADSLGDDEDNDDEGRPVDAHDEHVPSCARRRPRRPCSRRRRR